MGYTLKSLVAALGKPRIQKAIADQLDYLKPQKFHAMRAFVQASYGKDARQTVKQTHFLLDFAGVRSQTDRYLFIAYALGKLDFVE